MLSRIRSSRIWRTGALSVLLTPLFVAVTAGAVPAAAATCPVSYTVTGAWATGFTADIGVTNLGTAALQSWTVGFTFPDPGQQVSYGWSAVWSQTGGVVTATNQPWNGSLAVGATTHIGFVGSYSGNNPTPTNITLNGVPCGGGTGPTVTVTSPSAGDVFIDGATVPLAAATSGSFWGTVTSVDFFVDGNPVGIDPTSPYTAAWTATVGTHTITATAFDSGGAVVTSAPVSILVRVGPVGLVMVDPTSVQVPEGGTATAAVHLSNQPTTATAVTVTVLRSSGDADLTVQSGAILTFTTTDWSTPQVVTIAAAADADTAAGTATFTVGTTNVHYLSSTLTATEIDSGGTPTPAVAIAGPVAGS